jgi:four helix bundle protein
MRNFRELEIWKNALELVVFTYSVTNNYADSEKFGLVSQMNRAAVSIPSNIAEGCSRNSDKEFKRYLEIAIGSAFELETQFILSYELKLMSEENYERSIKEINSLQKQINKFITVISNRYSPNT